MVTYIARRLLALIPVLFGITLLAFTMGAIAPGDPAALIYMTKNGEPPPNKAAVEAIQEELGLNDPLHVQYIRWTANAIRGDLGISYRTGQPITSEFTRHLPTTIRLAAYGLLIGLIISFPLGIIAAVYHNSLPDITMRFFSMLGAAMPAFWVAYIMILIFSVRLHWLPVAGVGTWRHMILPASVLGIGSAASLSRLLRSSLLEVLRTDYVRAARAKGVKERKVVLAHALRNALIPVVTYLGNLFGFLTSGAVIVETVFAIPGIGRVITSAIGFRDYPVIQGFVVYTGILFVLVNLIVDLSYSVIDPRVQLAGSRSQRG